MIWDNSEINFQIIRLPCSCTSHLFILVQVIVFFKGTIDSPSCILTFTLAFPYSSSPPPPTDESSFQHATQIVTCLHQSLQQSSVTLRIKPSPYPVSKLHVLTCLPELPVLSLSRAGKLERRFCYRPSCNLPLSLLLYPLVFLGSFSVFFSA